MAVVRLANGADVSVKLSVEEVKTAVSGSSRGFVELPGEDGPFLVRPDAVIAIVEDSRRGSAGFRIGSVASSSG